MTSIRSTTVNSGGAGHVVLLLDASTTVGGGHAYRCLALADELTTRGAQCLFAVGPDAASLVPGLLRHDLLMLDLAHRSVPEHLAKARPDGVDWLVVDHYGLGAAFERACRPWAQRVLAIDDLANRPHNAELLLDQTPGRVQSSYSGLLAPDCNALVGATFALLRPEFAQLRPMALARREAGGSVERVVIALGAADPDNHAARALALLCATQIDASVEVILGPQATHSRAVHRLAQQCPFPVEVVHGVDDMAARLARADLAIGAGGISALERCCLGLPSLLMLLAANQTANAEFLVHAGAALVIGNGLAQESPGTASTLRSLIASEAARRDMSRAGAALCDGCGTARAAAAMMEFCVCN